MGSQNNCHIYQGDCNLSLDKLSLIILTLAQVIFYAIETFIPHHPEMFP